MSFRLPSSSSSLASCNHKLTRLTLDWIFNHPVCNVSHQMESNLMWWLQGEIIKKKVASRSWGEMKIDEPSLTTWTMLNRQFFFGIALDVWLRMYKCAKSDFSIVWVFRKKKESCVNTEKVAWNRNFIDLLYDENRIFHRTQKTTIEATRPRESKNSKSPDKKKIVQPQIEWERNYLIDIGSGTHERKFISNFQFQPRCSEM